MIVETSVPAKINLWLEVIRKREDGYHDISSLMVPISVCDRLRIEVFPEDGPVSLSCDFPEVPADGRNLAYRAADLFRKACGTGAAIRIDLEKSIPAGAGLGGGSADAAGVLLALNSCFDNVLPGSALSGLARGLGADVPFFLGQKPALATGIGERLEWARGVPDYPLLLIKPPISVPTAWVYQNLKLTRGRPQIKLNNFTAHPWRLGEFAANDLESVTVAKYPVVSGLKGWLLGRGALAASMSGSGPTVFGVFASGEAAGAAEAEARMAWKDCWVRAARAIGSPGAVAARREGPRPPR